MKHERTHVQLTRERLRVSDPRAHQWASEPEVERDVGRARLADLAVLQPVDEGEDDRPADRDLRLGVALPVQQPRPVQHLLPEPIFLESGTQNYAVA